jgi:SH3-like domain-containing protein
MRFLATACVLNLLLASPLAAQTTGTLQVPPKQPSTQPSQPSQPTPPKAAPREPVHQVTGKPPPVVKPHGETHAQKPVTKPAAKPAAAKPAAPPPPVVAAPTPTPPPEPAKPETPDKGTVTGLPLPRFASLRADEVNMRAGPGTRYPIQWVYKRRDLPVEIEREFEVWRLVEDPDGTKGWVHQATLTGRRSFIVGSADATLRRSAAEDATPVAILKPGVIGHIRSCDHASNWCEVQVGEYRGWLRRGEFWGTLDGEAVTN